MIAQQIIYFGRYYIVACDRKCEKAWGICNRPKVQLSEDENDYEYLADDELGDAPDDPGTYEGGQAKPTASKYPRMNKWCVRECERSEMAEPCEEFTLPDYSKRVRNMPPTDPAPEPGPTKEETPEHTCGTCYYYTTERTENGQGWCRAWYSTPDAYLADAHGGVADYRYHEPTDACGYYDSWAPIDTPKCESCQHHAKGKNLYTQCGAKHRGFQTRDDTPCWNCKQYAPKEASS